MWCHVLIKTLNDANCKPQRVSNRSGSKKRADMGCRLSKSGICQSAKWMTV